MVMQEHSHRVSCSRISLHFFQSDEIIIPLLDWRRRLELLQVRGQEQSTHTLHALHLHTLSLTIELQIKHMTLALALCDADLLISQILTNLADYSINNLQMQHLIL